MKAIMTRTVPAWILAVAILAILAISAFAWIQADEVRYLRNAIRTKEAAVPGFLDSTSPLSDEALCRRSPFIRLKDRILGSNSCSKSF